MNYYNEIDPVAAQWLRELITDGLIPNGHVDERSICDVQGSELDGYVQCHFFAGIGGWPLALRIAGWPDDRPCWTGSCPCQPFSCAGRRKAQSDERHLWPQMFRLVRECRPVRVFGEQVANAIGHGWLDGISADLEAENYACGAVVLGAHSINAPHIRQRLYWLADLQQERTWNGIAGIERQEEFRRDRLAIDGEPCGMGNAKQPRLERPAGHGDGSGEPGRLETQATGSTPPTSCVNPWSDFHIVPCRDKKRRRIPALPESLVQRMADGFPVSVDDMRPESGFPLSPAIKGRAAMLKGYGNAINPYVAAEFIAASMERA